MNIFLDGYDQMKYLIGEEVIGEKLNGMPGKEYFINGYYEIKNKEIHVCSMYLFDNDIILISIIEDSSTYIKGVKLNETESIICMVETRIPSMHLDNLDDIYGPYLYSGLKDMDLKLAKNKPYMLAVNYFGFPAANKQDVKTLKFTFKYYIDNIPQYKTL